MGSDRSVHRVLDHVAMDLLTIQVLLDGIVAVAVLTMLVAEVRITRHGLEEELHMVTHDLGRFRAFHLRKADFRHKTRHALSAAGGNITILTNVQRLIKCVIIVNVAGISVLFAAQQHATVVSL